TEAAPVATVGSDHRFTIDVGGEAVLLRLAVRSHEQRRGLMHVKSMPENEGMLFLYQEPQRASFWMRNTFIPLDIGFFDPEGVLIEVRAMYPHVEDPVASGSENIQYSLEMNKGWFAAHGVKAGAKLDLAALRDALTARGFDADEYVNAASD
ncbi:MAG: DUF192 domain-containing protein, partial [Opitutaceae bacterium]